MKILFLDYDGVLNSERTVIATGGYPHELHEQGKFDQVAVRMIQQLCKKTGASVVLSTSWRIYKKWSLEDHAKAFNLPVIGATPDSTTGTRGLEINAWLEEHPEVTQYAIVDDNDDMLPDQIPFFVHTSEYEGLSYANYIQLKRILT